MSVPSQIKWIATATNGPGEGGIKEFFYTSDAAPVDADEHARVLQRAEQAEAKLATEKHRSDHHMIAAANLRGDNANLLDELAALAVRVEQAEAKLAAVPLDDIQRMQGCEAHTKRTEWAKIRVINWLRQQGRYGYPPERANITVDGETCPCCGDSDVYQDATGTWRQCGDCEYAWQPKPQAVQP